MVDDDITMLELDTRGAADASKAKPGGKEAAGAKPIPVAEQMKEQLSELDKDIAPLPVSSLPLYGNTIDEVFYTTPRESFCGMTRENIIQKFSEILKLEQKVDEDALKAGGSILFPMQ